MPQQNHRFVVISSLKYTLQNVVFLRTIKANLLFCEHLWRLLLIYASQPSAKTLITWALQSVSTMHIAVKTAILDQWERKCKVGSQEFTCKISKN